MSLVGECSVCKALSKQRCASCQLVYYCTREHQKQHWNRHKRECCPFKVKTDPILGRHLVSTRNLTVGDAILKEQPLVRGPSDKYVVCLGCYKLLDENSAQECPKCGWPVCSKECAASAHHVPECHYTVLSGRKIHIPPLPIFPCITILRCLYQRDHYPATWERLQNLESHCDKRRSSAGWDEEKRMVDFIRTYFKLENVFNEDEIMKCRGILQVNGHEVPVPKPSNITYTAVYDKSSLVEHNCWHNCTKNFTSTGDMILTAGVDMAAGEHLSICYTEPTWGTEVRRHDLAKSKFFECKCSRCAVVTEFGTMFSAVNCKSGSCNGLLLPDTFMLPIIDQKEREDFLKKGRFWKCNECNVEVCDEKIQQLLKEVGAAVNAMDKENFDTCERFITHYSQFLPASHYYLTDVRLDMVQLLSQENNKNLALVSDHKLELMIQLYRNISQLLENLIPAETYARGDILFRLHVALAETGDRKAKLEGAVTALYHMQESREILAKSMKFHRHEHAELKEIKIAQQAAQHMKEMDLIIATLSAACLK